MYDYLLYFLIFSFLGWCAEVVFYIIRTGRLVNRGFITGPFCPIYGIGICLSYFLLGSVESFVLLSVLSMAIATIVEFSVGYIIDKGLGRRLWDYTSEKGNILGYVCPRFSIIWGVVCASVIKFIPRLNPVTERMKTPFGYLFSFSLLTFILIDAKCEAKTKKALR